MGKDLVFICHHGISQTIGALFIGPKHAMLLTSAGDFKIDNNPSVIVWWRLQQNLVFLPSLLFEALVLNKTKLSSQRIFAL